jgi:hypothetical protein
LLSGVVVLHPVAAGDRLLLGGVTGKRKRQLSIRLIAETAIKTTGTDHSSVNLQAGKPT